MTIHFLPPELDRYDAAVEDAIATCNGDIMGALKALLIVNERYWSARSHLYVWVHPDDDRR